MLKLRSLVVITGAIRADGGAPPGGAKRTFSDAPPGGAKRTFSDARKRANVIIVDYARRLRRKRLLRTPYGVLYDATKLGELKVILLAVTKAIFEFNAGSTKCQLTNCLIWEHLQGNRKGAVEGWLAVRIEAQDAKVLAVLPALQATSMAIEPHAIAPA